MNNFKLKKVKLLDGLGLDVTYNEKVVKGSETYWLEKNVKSTIQRHPDLDDVIDEYRIHVARIFGLMAIGMYKPEDAFTKQEKEMLDQILDTIKVVGISLTGEDDICGVVISAKKKVFESKTVVMNTPNMVFTDEKYDYSYELGEISERLLEECYEYLFKRKYAQLDLFTEGEEVTNLEEETA